MKKVFNCSVVMVLMTLCVGFSSCSSDEEGSGSNTIVGKWYEFKEEKVSGIECITSSFNPDSWWQFKDDGTWEYYHVDDNETERGTWSINGSILTITDSSFPIPVPVQIVELTNSTFVCRLELPCFGTDDAITVRTYKKR